MIKTKYRIENELIKFVKNCNVIIHLASLNRHDDNNFLFTENVDITKRLISALELSNSNPPIIFSSSIQENLKNNYGKSKKISSSLLKKWAELNNGNVLSLSIPNVFGPFCKPFYNSVVATFCYQLVSGKTPFIDNDKKLELIYVSELIDIIVEFVEKFSPAKNPKKSFIKTTIGPSKVITVSRILKKLNDFKSLYIKNGIIPNLSNDFNKNLFNTFLCYLDHESWFPFILKLNTDKRGSFVETMKFNSSGQVSFSTTKPGITRGNHYHTRKFERFAVIDGKALIQLRKIGSSKIYDFILDGSTPSFVDMPIWFTHNIKNIGSKDLLTLFWINEEYDKNNPDTYFEKV